MRKILKFFNPPDPVKSDPSLTKEDLIGGMRTLLYMTFAVFTEHLLAHFSGRRLDEFTLESLLNVLPVIIVVTAADVYRRMCRTNPQIGKEDQSDKRTANELSTSDTDLSIDRVLSVPEIPSESSVGCSESQDAVRASENAEQNGSSEAKN